MNKTYELRVKILLGISIIIAIALYKLITYLFPNYPIIEGISELVSIISTGVIYLLTSKFKFIVKIFEKENYIAGIYSGTSTITSDNSDENNKSREKVIIKQSFLLTTIKGETIKSNGFKSFWSGILVKSINETYTFFIELENSEELIKGICTLSKMGLELKGFYLSTSNTNNKAIINLEKE